MVLTGCIHIINSDCQYGFDSFKFVLWTGSDNCLQILFASGVFLYHSKQLLMYVLNYQSRKIANWFVACRNMCLQPEWHEVYRNCLTLRLWVVLVFAQPLVFLCSALYIMFCPIVLFLLTYVLSVLLRLKVYDYRFGICQLFMRKYQSWWTTSPQTVVAVAIPSMRTWINEGAITNGHSRDIGTRQKKHTLHRKQKRWATRIPATNRGWTHEIAKSKQFLPLIRHLSCTSFIQEVLETTIRKSTQVTYIRHQPFYNQLGVKTNQT
jgi:hypothetical protein